MGPISTFLSAPEVSKVVDLLGADNDWIDKLCCIHMQDSTLISNPSLKLIVETTMSYFTDLLNKTAKPDIITIFEKIAKEESHEEALINSMNCFKNYFPEKGEKYPKVKSSVISQIEFPSVAQSNKLLDSSNKVSKNVLLKKVLTKNILFLRMMNPSFFFTTVEHQLAREKIDAKKHHWDYPFMADFFLPEGLPQLQKKGEKPVPIAIFVADSDSFVVSSPGLPRYLVSQSKLYFKNKGCVIVTIQPEHLKLKLNPDILTELILSTSKTTISLTN